MATALSFGQKYPVVLVPDSPHGIYTMMQDSQSRLWIGTIDDVVCFDGAHFYSLRQYGFPKEVPNSFAEDGEGGIWIATQSTAAMGGTRHGGLYRYQSGHVEKLFSADGLSVVNIAPTTMLASFGTEAQGHPTYGDLYRFQKKGKSWTADRLSEQRAHHLTVDAQGTTLFPCPGGWCELPRGAILEWKPGAQLALQEHTGNPLVERVLRDRFGCVWFRAEAAASYQCPGEPALTTISNTILGYDSSAHLEETSDGSIFMLVSMTLGRPGNFHTITSAQGVPSDMDSATVAKDGTIWIGTDRGLYRFMYPFRVETWNQDDGLGAVGSLLRIGGTVFAATSIGIKTFDKDRHTWTTLQGSRPLNGVGALAAGPAGTIFAASASGVAQLREDGTILARSGFWDEGTVLATTKDGQVWLGSGLSKRGIRRVSTKGSRLILTSENLPLEPSADFSYDAERDTLWACNGNGLAFRRNGVWGRMTSKDGLLDFTCRTVAADPNGDVWYGYENSRLALIRDPFSGHPTIRNYAGRSDQLVGNTANQSLRIDRRGWVWRASDALYLATSTTAENDEWLRLDQGDGLPPGANQNSFFSDSDGSVWYGSGTTIVHFSPAEDFATNFPAPQVTVSGFSVDGGVPVLADTIASFPHNSDLTVHVGSLQFDRRSALRLRYRLLPGQTSWISQSDLSIHLGKLRFGTHTLEVQAQLGSGPWSATTGKFFTVLKPIWLSWPAILGFALTSGIGAAGTYRLQKARKKRNSKTLPALAEWRLAALSPEYWSLEGTVLDSRFEVGRVLARGGFATVAEGRDLRQDGRACAVKIFRQELMDNNWMARRFQQEVLALEKIQHPNVVRIYGHGATAGGSPYLVMEFVDGQTLRDRLEEGGLTPQQTASYLRQIGGALHEIHAHGICHRDLKPENLMIRRTALAGRELVLIDFSIAIVRDPDQTLHGLSRAAGTIYYMAPEQSIGYADSSTDIYSLAKIVIEMLTGQRLSTLLPDASMDLPDRVRELLAGLGLGLSSYSIDLMSSALEFDPSQRPKGAKEFAQRIAQDLESVSETI